MNSLNAPRGTRDILPNRYPIWNFVEQSARQVMLLCNFQPIRTPLYEEVSLFERSIGAGTDVMDKELFLVRGKHSEEEGYALRPEGTAGIVRAYIQHGMHTLPQPVKLYSIVNNFRYERPQKGRYREHWQLSIEYLGEKGAFADAWIIFTSWTLFQTLGIKDITLKLNTLGTSEERRVYLEAFKGYLTPHQEKLSADSQRRLSLNPLRILDSKDPADQALLEKAPLLDTFLSPDSLEHFNAVKKYLDAWQIPYVRDTRLVRGLDYYSHTTFEWISTHLQGAQDSLGGGGRYDALLPQLGGPNVGAVGVGLGLDRIVEELEILKPELLQLTSPTVQVVAADSTGKEHAPKLIQRLIEAGIACEAVLDKESMSAQLKYAGRNGARWAVLIGEQEANNNTLVLKDLSNGEQTSLTIEELLSKLGNAS